MVPLEFKNISAIPLVHGRVAFAVEVRRRLLSERFDAIAVELPPSLLPGVQIAIDQLPRVSVVLYREKPAFLDPANDHLWYVPIDPCDGIIEGLRIASGERTPVHFIDAEIEEFRPRPLRMPDPHALHRTGLAPWYEATLPHLRRVPRTREDGHRERHLAARLLGLIDVVGPNGRILYLGGIAHWERIRRHLEAGTPALHEGTGPDQELIRVETAHRRSLVHILGESPFMTWAFERHRRGVSPTDFDPVAALQDLLFAARNRHRRQFPGSLEKTDAGTLRTCLLYARKLTVCEGWLLPDPGTLAVAAKGVVGNDFAVALLETLNRYPPNKGFEDALRMTEDEGVIEGEPAPLSNRAPGEIRSFRRLNLFRRPSRRDADRWRMAWNPLRQCSWPPEDVVIENFRDYVSKRALSLAGIGLRKTEPFTSSFKDGLAVRETLRDWHTGRIHVKDEPQVAGKVGAFVLIFDEDPDGTRFPWRTTWSAEHENESTLAFYATNPLEHLVGPGIGRIDYGGCLFLFPPIEIPDVWDDLRFERARVPSERLLLAALGHSRDRFIIHAAKTPPAPEVYAEASRLGRHLIHLPLTSFSAPTLERLRRAHVLNGHEVRSWASRFIG